MPEDFGELKIAITLATDQLDKDIAKIKRRIKNLTADIVEEERKIKEESLFVKDPQTDPKIMEMRARLEVRNGILKTYKQELGFLEQNSLMLQRILKYNKGNAALRYKSYENAKKVKHVQEQLEKIAKKKAKEEEKAEKAKQKIIKEMQREEQRRLKNEAKLQQLQMKRLKQLKEAVKELKKEEIIMKKRKMLMRDTIKELKKYQESPSRYKLSRRVESFAESLTKDGRLYAILSGRGLHMVASMSGKMAGVLGILAAAGQALGTALRQGIQHLIEYESLARRIAYIQTGQTGVSFTQTYEDTRLGMIRGTPSTINWTRLGISKAEGAQLEIIRMQSGLKITDEQLKQIAITSKYAGEESSEFLMNLINLIRMFKIETEDIDETISMFGMLGAQTFGGTSGLIQTVDYIAGLAETGKWDWRQVMMLQQTVKQKGMDPSRFWRGFRGVIAKGLEEDVFVKNLRNINGQLRSFDEVLWIIDETMDQFGDEAQAAAWATEVFGETGYNAIQITRDLINDFSELSTVIKDSKEFQEKANDAADDLADTFENSVTAKVTKLQESIESFQAALANLVAGPLTWFFDTLADTTNALSGFIVDKAEEEGRTYINEEGVGTVLDWLGLTNKTDSCGRSSDDPDYGKPCNEGSNKPSGRKTPDCGEGYYWNGYECVPEGGGGGIGAPESWEPGFGSGSGGITNIINKKSVGGSSNIVNNYITILDNDNAIRQVIGVNLNVQ